MARFPSPDVAAALKAAALAERVPLSLLMGVAMAESGFDPSKVGPATSSGEHAQGLMQLMPATQKLFKVSSPLDATQSALGGAKFLARLANKFEWNVPAMLAAYNWGPVSYLKAKAAGQPVPGEVQRYVRKVLAAQHFYRLQAPRVPGQLMVALNHAIVQLAEANPLHVPATQLASDWAKFFKARGRDTDTEAVTNPQVKTYWRAYATVHERAPLDVAATDPSLVEPDFWLKAANTADAAQKWAADAWKRFKGGAEQAAYGLGAGLFVLALFYFVAGSSKRR